jgi:hypothetical protein
VNQLKDEHDFILVDAPLYDKVLPLINDERNHDTIAALLQNCPRSKENPVPEKDAQGVFWRGDLILKVESP